MKRLIPAVAMAAALLMVTSLPLHADDDADETVALTVPEIIVQAADAYGVSSAAMLAVAKCESGFSAEQTGDHGTSWGVYQLRVPGLRSTFYAWGYDDAFDAGQSAEFVARWIALTGNWRPWWTCSGRLGLR